MDVMVIARCMIKLFIVLVLGFVLYRFDILHRTLFFRGCSQRMGG